MPGGGYTVRAPRLWTRSDALARGSDATLQSHSGTTVTVAITLTWLVQVTLEASKPTGQLLQLVKSRDRRAARATGGW